MVQIMNDEDLVQRIQNGEVLVFEKLVRKYQRRLLSFVRRMVADEKLAEEIVQDAFVKCYLAIDRVDLSRKFSTYLFEIAKNTAISALRTQKNTLPLKEDFLISDEETNFERIAREQEMGEVRSRVEQLEDKYRNIITMRYFQDRSYTEIARKLRLPVNTVRTHLRRAKERLKQIYETE